MKKKTHALLIYPEVPKNTYWSFQYALNFVGKKSAMPPLGLITLAAYFPDTYDLRLIDLNIQPLADKDLEWADAVFISAMIVQQESFDRTVARCNSFNKPVIAGGPYPTSSHETITGVDHFVLGEVEEIFETFVADFEKGAAKSVYSADSKPSLSRARAPRFDLLDMEAYCSMAVQYSRGCPFSCEFCDIWSVYGNKPRLKTGEQMIAELSALYRLGWRGPVFVVDDNFIGNKRMVKKALLPALIEWQQARGYAFRFFTEASINLADDADLMSAMRSAGFDEVFIGIETPSREALKETGKTQNLKSDMREAIRRIQRHGMEVMAGFIIGFDSDTKDIAARQVEFIQQTGIPQAMVGLLTALPGTKLYRRLEREGRLLWASAGNNTHCRATNFQPKMGTETLLQNYTKVLSTIYDRNMKNYFARCSRLLDRIGQSALFSRDISKKEIKVLLRSFLRQPFTAYGYQYVKFLLINLLKHRDVFSEAVRFGIIAHHFHKITQEMVKVEKIAHYLDEIYSTAKKRVMCCLESTHPSDPSRHRQMDEIFRQYRKILQKTQVRINRIHADFQKEILDKYNEITHKIHQLASV